MQNKKLVERIRTYIIKNGNTIKNYVMMCEILDEKTTSGEAKQNQLDRWKVYFDYKKTGHKFEIIKIYDDETIEENEKEYFNETEIRKLFSRSPYRKDLIAILIYIVRSSQDGNLLTNEINLAIQCGLLNKNVKGKIKYKDYIDFRKLLISEGIRKEYFSIGMYKLLYCIFSRSLKNGVYKIIKSALNALKELKLITYRIIYVGLKGKDLVALTFDEIVKYEQIEDEILAEIYPAYLKEASRPKDKIKIQDLMYYPHLLEKFYDIKGEKVKEMGYKNISKYYDIYLADDFEHPETIEEIKNEKDFDKVSKRLNKTYVDKVLEREKTKIKKAKAESEGINTELYIGIGDMDAWYQFKRIAYYNKVELLDQYVNCNESIDVANIDDEYTDIINVDSCISAYEILKDLKIFSKKIQEDELIIKEEAYDELMKEETVLTS